MKRTPLVLTLLLSASLLPGCAILPPESPRYYGGETVIVAPAPRIEYIAPRRVVTPLWVGGFWDRDHHRHAHRPPPPPSHRRAHDERHDHR